MTKAEKTAKLKEAGLDDEAIAAIIAGEDNSKEIAALNAKIAEAEAKGAQVFIAAAGMAAHLAGVLSSKTVKPIIGVPLSGSALSGIDALLSTVQMPAGMPVATVAIGKAGAINSAYLAMQILALNNEELAVKLKEDRIAKAKKVEMDSSEIETIISL